MSEYRGCFYPLNVLAIHPQGEQKFCLTSTLRPSEKAEVFQEQAIQIHEQLMRGEWPESCRSCRLKEENGLQSRRQKTWSRKLRIYDTEKFNKIQQAQDKPVLRHLEISFSNICNLNCAMCSSEFSSSWIADDAKAVKEGLEFRNFTGAYGKIQRISEEKMEDLLSRTQDLDLVIIKGGEPTRDPQCIEFLNRLSERSAENPPTVFLQTNGTRHPREWLPAVQSGLLLEVGFSLDGWGGVYEWIRGTDFETVLNNFKILDESSQVRSLSVDFTLSAYNAFHFPEFLTKILQLKKQMKKLEICPSFQWAQESYARVDSLRLEDRLAIRDLVRPLFESEPHFFSNFESILSVLEQTQVPEASRQNARRWIDYMNDLRGHSIYDLQPQLKQALL